MTLTFVNQFRTSVYTFTFVWMVGFFTLLFGGARIVDVIVGKAYSQTPKAALAIPLNEYAPLFNKYKATAVALLEEHVAEHSNCDLAQSLDTLRTMTIQYAPFNGTPNKGARAYAMPSINWMIVNLDWDDWSERQGVETIIHEALHNVRTKHGYLCGKDRPHRANPVAACDLMGKQLIDSDDIDNALYAHLSALGSLSKSKAALAFASARNGE